MSLVPTSVAVICQSQEMRAPIERVLANDVRIRLSDIRRADDLPLDEAGRNFPDALIFCLDDLRRSPPDLAIRISRRTTIVIALVASDVLHLSAYATVADSWLFLDDQVSLSAEIVLLGLDRYCLVPHFVSPVFSPTGIRLQLMAELSDLELQVLEELGAGAANRDIAARLGLSETGVKYVVRNVLTKLYLPNRTKAAVLMHVTASGQAPTRPIDRRKDGA